MASKKFVVSGSEPTQNSKFKSVSTTTAENPSSEPKFSVRNERAATPQAEQRNKKFAPTKFTSQPFTSLMRKLPDVSNLPPIDDAIEKIVFINSQTGEVVNSPGFLRFGVRRSITAYLISTQAHIEREKLLCRIKDVSSNRGLSLAITYGAKCPRGNEERLVKALYKDDMPGTAFDQLIDRWLKEYYHTKLEHNIDFISQYYALRPDLQNYLVNKALDVTGITLEVHIRLELELLELLGPFEMPSEKFSVRVADYEAEIGLTFQGVFDVDEDGKIQAVLAYSDLPTLNERIRQWVQAYMLQHVSIDDFYAHDNATLRQRVGEYLDEKLKPEGRKVSFLQLSSELTDSLPPEFSSFTLELDCIVKDSPTPISVKHELLMDLEKPAKYKLAGIENLESWARTKLEKITKIVLFEKNYADLILDIAEIQRDIKQGIDQEAAEIGYTVQHLLMIPNLEAFTLHRDGFRIEETRQFITKDINVEVKLSIVLSGKLGDLGAIRAYLKPNTNLLEEIKKVLLTSLKDSIHGVAAERFYMHFYARDNEDPPFEQVLHETATRRLVEKFSLEDINLLLNPVETEITQRLQRLQSGVHGFNFKATPLRSGEYIEFSLKFKVLSVAANGWYAFQSNRYDTLEEEVAAIIEVLREDLKTKLDTVPTEILQYEDIKELHDIHKIIVRSTAEIERIFGLVIGITSFRRLLSDSEQVLLTRGATDRKISLEQNNARAAMANITNQQDHALLMRLYERRNEILSDLDPDNEEDLKEELAMIEKRIKEIEEKTAYAPAGKPQTPVLEDQSERKRQFSFTDYDADAGTAVPRLESDNRDED